MHSSEKGSKWYFETKVHIGVDADSGLVHDINEGNSLLHGQDSWHQPDKNRWSSQMRATRVYKSGWMQSLK